MGVAISQNALLRFRERGNGSSELCDDVLRAQLEARLDRAARAAASIGVADYLILIADLAYIVRGGTATTVITADSPYRRVKLLHSGRMS